MNIKHIVLSGGGYNGIDMIGILYKLSSLDIIERTEIKSLYGVSAGSIVSAIWLLNIEKNVIYDFIIKRPWNKIFNINSDMLFKLVDEKGLLDNRLFIEIMKPLLKSKDLNENITLLEFYKYTKKDFYIFGTKLNTLESVKMSHKTHPEMKLIDALTISSALPLIFKPVFYDNEYYIDGGVRKHFPIKTAINDGCNRNEIIGIYIKRNNDDKINKESTFIQYYYKLLITTVNLINKDFEEIPNIIYHICEKLGIHKDILTNNSKRESMLKKGEESALKFINEKLNIDKKLESSIEELA